MTGVTVWGHSATENWAGADLGTHPSGCWPLYYENVRETIYWVCIPGDVCLCLSASCSTWMSQAQTEFKKVAGANVTLPCHHRLHLLESTSLDIEWLFQKPNTDSEASHKVVCLALICSKFSVGAYYPQIDSRKPVCSKVLNYVYIWSKCEKMSGLSALWASCKC